METIVEIATRGEKGLPRLPLTPAEIQILSAFLLGTLSQ